MSVEQDMGILATQLQGAKDHAALVRIGAAIERLRAVVQQAIDAFDKGALALSSVEIGDPDSGIPMHPWHEEWLHHARQAVQQTVPENPK